MTWNGPTIGVMRPGMLAVSGCRPPKLQDVGEGRIYEAIILDVEQHVKGIDMPVVHGGAVGVDQTASRSSRHRGERYLPDYARDGKAAPLVRNAYVTTTERFCAWPAPWSRGTWDAVKKRLKACGANGFEVRIVAWPRAIELPKDVLALLDKYGLTWTEVG